MSDVINYEKKGLGRITKAREGIKLMAWNMQRFSSALKWPQLCARFLYSPNYIGHWIVFLPFHEKIWRQKHGIFTDCLCFHWIYFHKKIFNHGIVCFRLWRRYPCEDIESNVTDLSCGNSVSPFISILTSLWKQLDTCEHTGLKNNCSPTNCQS